MQILRRFFSELDLAVRGVLELDVQTVQGEEDTGSSGCVGRCNVSVVEIVHQVRAECAQLAKDHALLLNGFEGYLLPDVFEVVSKCESWTGNMSCK